MHKRFLLAPKSLGTVNIRAIYLDSGHCSHIHIHVFHKIPRLQSHLLQGKLPFLWNIGAQRQDKYKMVIVLSHLQNINLHTLPFSNTTRQLKWASVSKGQPGLYCIVAS